MKKYYQNYFSDDSFWNKLKKIARKTGIQLIYVALILFYVLKSPSSSLKAKLVVLGALGYFICPADAIPDWTPILGFSDDFGVLMYAIREVKGQISPEIKILARNKLTEWFSEVSDSVYQNIDQITQ